MAAAPVHIAGERLMLDPAGLLHWPARWLLCVADLHLEKGSAFAARGQLLPPYDSRETIARLLPPAALLLCHCPPDLQARKQQQRQQRRPDPPQARRRPRTSRP